MIPTPPKRLMLTEVEKYIRLKYGHDGFTRKTIYNWVTTGKRGVILKTTTSSIYQPLGGRPNERVTLSIWVDQFLREAYPNIV